MYNLKISQSVLARCWLSRNSCKTKLFWQDWKFPSQQKIAEKKSKSFYYFQNFWKATRPCTSLAQSSWVSLMPPRLSSYAMMVSDILVSLFTYGMREKSRNILDSVKWKSFNWKVSQRHEWLYHDFVTRPHKNFFQISTKHGNWYGPFITLTYQTVEWFLL